MTRESNPNLHPGAALLALFSSDDLPWRDIWRLRRHVTHCDECEHKIAEYRAAKVELRREAQTETLTAFEAITDWSVLEREMLGNIAVGVAAARAIHRTGHAPLLTKAAISAGLVLLFAAGWLTHIPGEQTARLFSLVRQMVTSNHRQLSGTLLKTTPDGIAVRAQGATLTIIHPASAIIAVAGPESVSARYVDQDTGEVTITRVYAQ